MKNSFYATLLLLFSWLSVVCQAKPLTGRYVVNFQQDGSFPKRSFSIKPDQRTLPGNPSYLADTNGYAASTFPPDDHPLNLEGYGVKTAFFESISWPLIYATHFLVANEMILTTNDVALNSKPYSRIPLEVFATVGWLLERYWNHNSPQLNPMDQTESVQDHPFEITTMMLPGQGQQQSGQQNSGQQNPTSASSGQQASPRAFFRLRLSGSGGGNQGPGQQQHTYGFNCYVGSCHGVCKVQPPSRSELAERGQQDSSSLARRETEPSIARLLFGNIGSDPSKNPHLPSLGESLVRVSHQETAALSDSEGVDEKVSGLLTEFFVRPIVNFLNYRVLVNKHNTDDEYVHLAAAMCNALGEEYAYIVDCCASFTHTFNFGFCHTLSRMAHVIKDFYANRSLNLDQFREDVIEGLNTDRQTLIEKIARRELERVNIILQQGPSMEDKYQPVGNFVLIFFALSANNLKEASDFFWKLCYTDADGNKITRDNPSPEYSEEFTTEPTDTYKYVYSSVRNIKDITHLQRLVNQLADYLIPSKGTASVSCENKPNQKTDCE
ncbi:hypothetical protein [Endozoicomonas sp. 8E]|uniref:hypothetical protein n=1 Tax=Endozoicomonas sp. 8E TaxID=3035692 RepID=UPI002938EDFA|nr:hypothetical protein [Endozoicomonas sp. 8E]WOG28477.1 hypothetical protein P6910_02140 [Endozoicomonas sp. 8E]